MSTTNSSSSFSASQLSILVDNASDLKDMLRVAESQALKGLSTTLNNNADQTPLYERVEAIVETILEKLFENPSQSHQLADTSLTYVLAKLESFLQNFSNLDLANATRYFLLSTRVSNCQNFSPSSSSLVSEANHGFDGENQCLFHAHNSVSIMSNPTCFSSSQLSVLVEHGVVLARILDQAKSHSGLGSTIILDGTLCQQVQVIVKNVVKKLNENQADLVEESITHVLLKIRSILQDLIKFDPSNQTVYTDLSTLVENSQDSCQVSLASSSGLQINHLELNQSFNFEAKFNNLTDERKQCLYCFSLFPEESEIERKVLTYWLVAMGLTDEKNKAGQLLADLVDEDFITCIVNTYRVRTGIYPQLIDRAFNDGSWHYSVAWLQDSAPSSSLDVHIELPAENIGVLLNIDKLIFYAEDTTLHCFTRRNNHVLQLAHFGSWKQNINKFIVVEDIGFLLKALKYMVNLRLLSLRGISGITEVPNSMYKLMSNLRVLDLRACHDLELVPEGIESLQELTHLDLSDCYLLKCVPKGIIKLTKLRVLKGFIVNPNDQTTKQASSSCQFKELSELQLLRKLAVRTRRMNFPTDEDLSTLCKLVRLQKLGIAWVGSAGDVQDDNISEDFPNVVEKLELRAVPKRIALRLLHLISSKDNLSLSKLHIIGGEIEELGSHLHCFESVTQLRLRYLPHLHLDWSQCKRAFPNLIRFDILECPKVVRLP